MTHKALSAKGEPRNLKREAIQSGVARMVSQGVNLILRVGYIAILARLLSPDDFGLVAMVVALTGIFDVFTTAGLSSATIQKHEISFDQVSALFWINILVGVFLALLCAASAYTISAFYHEPRLLRIAIAVAPAFLLNAAGVQHAALIERDLRYVTLSAIETGALCVGILSGVLLALRGYGYWALIAPTLISPAINSLGCWIATGWIPGWPRRGANIRSLLHFGGIVTLNNLVVYIGYNVEKVLLGRLWGAASLGLYTRAFQLIGIPTATINSAVGAVLFSALSRMQHDPARLRNFYLKGYSIVIAVTVPITMFSFLFAHEIITVVLGSQWTGAATIFRLLTPTILVFGIINPTYWLLISTGKQKRSLYLAFAIAPLVITSYCAGISFGPEGVALSYSTALVLWLYPHLVWSLHGTPVSVGDLLRTIMRPWMAGIVASVGALAVQRYLGPEVPSLLRLAAGGLVLMSIYAFVLLFVLGQLKLFQDVLLGFRGEARAGA
ncbi:lipopolysaccharide biosynthesis protein [Mesorhizobium sp. M7A.F.Ca.US.014.04.1.1]|uniref:lipopolysaccharide biosynthesis protein n=1 Tax=Mesorhizobium sp. M7A.F.Ca.US.014.04.1.1 TaxID=2496744 RepID=UPI000FCC41DF|nr:lipopolysaccharide biosynthesis protein [Mesorhizobium sp. M7A.F.Ca.US.014.04.1.1]RUX62327.1 lipopolysaccharide biosynthesis protein [Mesorhizobium sp. M7A.F.Ca.US.014.04.1.1]